MAAAQLQAVLFDLDGTLADTAPDLAYALNCMRVARGIPELPRGELRALIRRWARAACSAMGFDVTPEHPDYAAMREEFLGLYAANLCRETRLFPGMPELLDAARDDGDSVGRRDQQSRALHAATARAARLDERAACVIGGDTTAHTKPHPRPCLLRASAWHRARTTASYVGDDERDVQAGRAAGMRTIVAKFGYLNGTTRKAGVQTP